MKHLIKVLAAFAVVLMVLGACGVTAPEMVDPTTSTNASDGYVIPDDGTAITGSTVTATVLRTNSSDQLVVELTWPHVKYAESYEVRYRYIGGMSAAEIAATEDDPSEYLLKATLAGSEYKSYDVYIVGGVFITNDTTNEDPSYILPSLSAGKYAFIVVPSTTLFFEDSVPSAPVVVSYDYAGDDPDIITDDLNISAIPSASGVYIEWDFDTNIYDTYTLARERYLSGPWAEETTISGIKTNADGDKLYVYDSNVVKGEKYKYTLGVSESSTGAYSKDTDSDYYEEVTIPELSSKYSISKPTIAITNWGSTHWDSQTLDIKDQVIDTSEYEKTGDPDDIVYVNYYFVYYSSDSATSGFTYLTADHDGNPDTNSQRVYLDNYTNFKEGTKYWLKVVPAYTNGTTTNFGPESDTVTVTTPTLATPSITVSAGTNSGQLKVTWDDVDCGDDNADKYEVYISSSEYVDYEATSSSDFALSFTDDGSSSFTHYFNKTADTTYYVVVKAKYEEFEKASAEKSGKSKE